MRASTVRSRFLDLYSIARYKKHPVKALKLWRGHATHGGSELSPPLPLGRRLPFPPVAHLACANPARPTLPALLEAVRGLRVTDLTSARR